MSDPTPPVDPTQTADPARPVPAARWSLPDHPSLERLRKQAKRLRRAAGAGETDASCLVETYDPGPGALTLARAQRVVARAYGFAGWSRLREHVETRDHWSRPMVASGPVGEAPADAFLRSACLTYTEPWAIIRARDLMRSTPDVALRTAATMAVCGAADVLVGLLTRDRAAATRESGPHRWPPVLYLCYARLGLGDPVATLRVLLAAGADPDSGFLWQGYPSPFTAVTGALGGGERDEPPHPHGVELATMLLDAGADPNDNQAFYNRQFRPDDSHLGPLLSHGAGRPRPSVWRDRLGTAYPSPAQMIGEHLRSAAAQGFTARVATLVAYGVDPNTRGYHPVLGDWTAYEVAVRHGHAEVARLLAEAGAHSDRLDVVDRLVAAALSGSGSAETTSAEPDELRRRRPDALSLAAEQHDVAAVGRLLALGYHVDDAAPTGRTALHEAALRGDRTMVTWLIDRGANPLLRDRDFDATAAGWAAHAGYTELAEWLQAHERLVQSD